MNARSAGVFFHLILRILLCSRRALFPEAEEELYFPDIGRQMPHRRWCGPDHAHFL